MKRAYVSRGWTRILQIKKNLSGIVGNSGNTSLLRLQEKKEGPENLTVIRKSSKTSEASEKQLHQDVPKALQKKKNTDCSWGTTGKR